MSKKRSDWLGLIDWLIDQFLFTGLPQVRSRFPGTESNDATEYEALRERARQIDAKSPTTPMNKPSSTKAADKLDKEFWDTQI